ncbi:MAG: UDP-N-acetylglucosamine--N-acetylmuramyl-(pentapeptide) pyrophosphoryl-undecaprenol N-acetylglucosamine transferase [Candidatus Liptonbacteria bacterium]|nr:UDP-N-acetylglucosamine--N-acetylmuramyl-(pentapeptide) pyrophosphoryl-undecaprenol N-acetylglucosamine transferase [Candidatus Liptonbacteria bacterium]
MGSPSDNLKIVLTGGGSGGHVYPLIAIVEATRRVALREKRLVELHYLGPKDEWSERLKSSDVQIHSIMGAKLRRYFSLLNFFDFFNFFIGLFQALGKLLFLMPDIIFSKGGTGSLAVVLVGWVYRIPVIIHESDAIPGFTNLISAKFAAKICVSFEAALTHFNPKKTILTGNPIRDEILEDRVMQRDAKELLGFNSKETLTLILGGSQGSERINNFILSNLEAILKETQVLHQTGKNNYSEIERLSKALDKSRYKIAPYLEKELKITLAAADLVISRAGSGVIFEAAAFGKPMVLIPLKESANDHQRVNAYEVAKTGAAIVIEEQNLLGTIFLNQLRQVISNREVLNKMSAAARQFFKTDAAEAITKEIFELIIK